MIIRAERKHAETVLAAERDADEQRRNARKLCIALIAAIIIILILFGGVGGLVTAVVSAFKDTAAVGATLASNDGHVMKTSKALTPVPLLAAPVLPQEQLEGIDSITVSYVDPTLQTKVRGNMQIAAAFHVSKTRVKLETASATVKEVLIWDGKATVTLADGSTADVCESDVRCSALMVDDAAQSDALHAEALRELEAANITDVEWAADAADADTDADNGAPLRLRRLSQTCRSASCRATSSTSARKDARKLSRGSMNSSAAPATNPGTRGGT